MYPFWNSSSVGNLTWLALGALHHPVTVPSSLSKGLSTSLAFSSIPPSACEARSVRGRVHRPRPLPRQPQIADHRPSVLLLV